jgi:chromosome segregation ATPase
LNIFEFLAEALHVPIEQVYAVTLLILCGGLIWLVLDRQRTNSKVRLSREETSEKVSVADSDIARTNALSNAQFNNRMLDLFGGLQKNNERYANSFENIVPMIAGLSTKIDTRYPLSEQHINQFAQQVDANQDQLLNTIRKQSDDFTDRVGDIPPQVWKHEVPLSFVERFESIDQHIGDINNKLATVSQAVTELSDAHDDDKRQYMEVYDRQQRQIEQLEAERDQARRVAIEKDKLLSAASMRITELEDQVRQLQNGAKIPSALNQRLDKRKTQEIEAK